MASALCPGCRTPRVGSFRYCRSCGLDDESLNYAASGLPEAAPSPSSAPPAGTQARAGLDLSSVVVWVWCLASLGGLVWLWVNAKSEDLLVKIIMVGMFEAVWVGIVSAVVGFVVLLFGMIGFVTRPLWRK